MMTKMKLTVIVPGYNNRIELWRRCVESVIAAAERCDGGVEILCVDDGSNDGSGERLAAWVETLDGGEKWCVKVIRQRNAGLAAARNAAISVAHGEFVTFIDSDDEIADGTFAACLEQLTATQSDVCFYGVKTIWFKDGLMKVDRPERRYYDTPTPTEVLSIFKADMLNYSCNKLYRRAFLDEHCLRFPIDGMPCEDIIFNLEVIMAGAKYCSVDYVGYVYYRGATTILSSYCKTFTAGMRKASDTWKRYKDRTEGAREMLGGLGEMSETALERVEKRNLLRPHSPLWYAPIYQLVRRIVYIRPVRRWHLKRVFPTVEDWK